MSFKKTILAFGMLCLFFSRYAESKAAQAQWYVGTWDSHYGIVIDHPKTVAISMELLDRDTHIPVKGAQVSLYGEYYQMWISQDIVLAETTPWWSIFVDPNKREPQPKEFRLDAVSDSDGVVVFALQWQKEFPWDSKIGDKWTYQVGDKWMVYLDDIEKVQRLEIRHPRYKYIEAPLKFQHVVGVQQYIEASRTIGANRYELFEQNWRGEIKRKNVKLFILDLGSELSKHREQFCKWPAFFEKVRLKEYGTVYKIPENISGLYRDSECGPYFVYDLGEVLLERVAQQIEIERQNKNILLGHSGDERVAVTEGVEETHVAESEPTTELPANEWKCPSCGQIYVGATVPKFCPQCGEEWTEGKAPVEANKKEAKIQESKPTEENIEELKQQAQKDPFGIAVETLTKEQRKEVGLPIGVQGVVIRYVLPGSHADKAGLEAGQVIEAVLRELVPTKKDYDEQSRRYKKGDQILISFWVQKRGKWERANVICYTYGSGGSLGGVQPGTPEYMVHKQGAFDAQDGKLQQRTVQETVLFADDFSDSRIDPSIWQWGQTRFSYQGTGKQEYKVEEGNGYLVIESYAEHERGWSSIQDVWLDSQADLKSDQDVAVDVELSGQVSGGSGAFLDILLSSGEVPTSRRDPASIRLFGDKDKAVSFSRKQVRIEISGLAKRASVYVDGKALEGYSKVDISSLPKWKLRVYVSTGTSAGFTPCRAQMKVYSVRVTELGSKVQGSGEPASERERLSGGRTSSY